MFIARVLALLSIAVVFGFILTVYGCVTVDKRVQVICLDHHCKPITAVTNTSDTDTKATDLLDATIPLR